MRTFFDAHCHLAGDGDRPPETAVAGDSVCGRVLCGVQPADWPRLARVAGDWRGSVVAYGVHPRCALTAADDWLDELERRLRADPGAWLGEAGLDGTHLESAPEKTQERVFSEQLRLARRLDRRVNLHCVRAWTALTGRLDAEYLAGGAGRGFLVHSFSGPYQCIGELKARGAYFSVGPLFARRDSRRRRECAALLPEDRLVLESDAFLVPGADNPDVLGHAFSWLAEARKTPAGALARRLLENSRRLASDG